MLQVQVANAALVRLIWSLAGQGTMVNVLGALIGSGPAVTQATANTLGTAIKGSLNSGTYKTRLHSGTSLVGVGVRDIRQVNLPEFIDNGVAVPGTGTLDALPRSAALVVSLRTALAGRGHRGRTYLGGFDESVNDPDGSASTLLLTDAATFMAAVQSALSAASMPLAVVGRNRNAKSTTVDVTNPDGSHSIKVRSYPASAGHVEAVTAIQVRNDTWDSQRRRTSPGSASTLFRPLVSFDVDSQELTTT